jgi:hypothetical protein
METPTPKIVELSDFAISYLALGKSGFNCEVLHTPSGKWRDGQAATYIRNKEVIEELAMELKNEGWSISVGLEIWLGWRPEG